MIKQAVLLTFAMLLSATSLGKTLLVNDVPIKVGSIIANGSGCPQGSMIISTTPNNNQISIVFSKYNAITNSNNTVAVADCNLALPLSVDAGYTVAIADINWYGAVHTSPNAMVNFHREYFFSGSTGPSVDSNWNGSGFEHFTLRDTPVLVYSGCDGAELIARADTAATVIGKNSLFVLRWADIDAKLLLTLDVKRC